MRDGLYGRVVAWLYDRVIANVEAAGLRGMRAELLAHAEGRTIELGAGTGLNLTHYGPRVRQLVLTEPSRAMAARLRTKTAAHAGVLIESVGEQLPFADASVDTIVATLVLCTVADPAAVLAEARRVLRPGGRLLFLEHVRARGPRVARWQDRLDRPWSWFGNGCHCNRDTRAAIERAAFVLDSARDCELPRVGPLMRPAILGVARCP